ncbi:DUF6483 family protein [Anaeromicropila herbilytica]|uniref:Uncharacterized protein n=1 Tax=Anaeromicropila herbilytica TaxID=2785025 RepID=A0A7R7ENY0_9FIRM|nr:DUF6483 family protein [Anaeromicropila herbilytica]BCN32277.1 hypothetical protein bsdtb5_35720 [Anaeromicropila herbilytica]
MSLKKDYASRKVKDVIDSVSKLYLGKQEPGYLPNGTNLEELDHLYKKIIQLADEGNINEAENELYQFLDFDDENLFELALSFYVHINEFDEDYLEEHDFSKDEILYGTQNIVRKFKGLTDIDFLFK